MLSSQHRMNKKVIINSPRLIGTYYDLGWTTDSSVDETMPVSGIDKSGISETSETPNLGRGVN